MTWFDYMRSFGRSALKERVIERDPTAGMRQPSMQFYATETLINQLPMYRIAYGRMMLRSDPIVRFALNVRNAALMVAEVEITAKRPEVQAWVQRQWDTIWGKHRNKMLAAKSWGFAPLQLVYKSGPGGLAEVEDVKDFAPELVRAQEISGKVCGFKIEDRKLRIPQALWLTFNSEYGSPYGSGLLQRQYPPWFEKWTDHGAKKLLQLRMFKDAYIGDIWWYPQNQLVEIPDGQGGTKRIPWRDLAREIGENRLSGNSTFLPTVMDDKGKKLLDYTPPQAVPGGTEIFEWNKNCDREILRGADVPLEVIEAQENGGFSGRSIPFMVVLSVCTGELTDYVTCLKESLRPAAWLNFGGDPEFDIKPKSLVESFAQDAGGSPMGGGAIGGQPGQRPEKPPQPPGGARMGWVGQDGNVTQFDEQDSRWVTIGGRKDGSEEHKGGFPVQLDSEGRIVKSGGPQGLIGKHVSQVGQHFGEERRTAAREQESKDWGGRKGWNTIVDRQAARWRIKPEVYEKIADQVWSERMHHHGERESAKQYARKRLNLNAGDISRLENQGFDSGSQHDRIKGLDTLSREMASLFPSLGWGGEEHGDKGDHSADLWDLVKEGKQELPSKASRDYHEAIDDYLREEWDRHKKRKATLVEDEPVDSSQFSEYLAMQFDEGGQLTEDIAAIGAKSAASRIRGAASRIRALKKNELLPLETLANAIENELYDLRRGISADLSASMLGGQLVGAADAWSTLPADFEPPPIAAVIPPAPPAEPPSLAGLLGPEEPTPSVRFPVVEDAIESSE
jgi:hypothetical protein